ncbi:MAG: GIY-YIG nuclease family protein [Selenomonadaceae bacterium]|nr:GIY-YIG nuclease family protein [Selenomonadaceae bacterium]
MKEPLIGIYSITCTVNGKQYVGQSIDIKRRKSQHRRNEENPKLRADIEKYGWDAFRFDVLELCEEKELTPREDYYLDTLQPEYNIRTEGNSISEIARQKLHDLRFGKKRPDLSKAVKCVELNKIFPSVRAAAEFCKLPHSNLSALLAGKGRTFGGYHWIWVYDDEEQEKAALERIAQMPEGHKHTAATREKQSQVKRGKKMSPECCAKMRESHTGKKWKRSTYEKLCRKIICVETGEIFSSIKSAAEKYGISPPNISVVLSGRKITAGGYQWERVEEENFE